MKLTKVVFILCLSIVSLISGIANAQPQADLVFYCSPENLLQNQLSETFQLSEKIPTFFAWGKNATSIQGVACLPESIEEMKVRGHSPIEFYVRFEFQNADDVGQVKESVGWFLKFEDEDPDNENEFELGSIQGLDNVQLVFRKNWLIIKTDSYDLDKSNLEKRTKPLQKWKPNPDKGLQLVLDLEAKGRLWEETSKAYIEDLNQFDQGMIFKQIQQLEFSLDLKGDDLIDAKFQCVSTPMAKAMSETLRGVFAEYQEKAEASKHRTTLENWMLQAVSSLKIEQKSDQVRLNMQQPEIQPSDQDNLAKESLIQERVNQAKRVALATHQFYDTNGRFPFLPDPNEPRNLSWRVRVLPDMEEDQIHQLFDPNEPWDGPNNQKMLDLVPEVYSDGETTVSWIQSDVRTFADITDGSSNTIALLLTRQDLNWTQPKDLTLEEALQEFRNLEDYQPLIGVRYDGSATLIYKDIGEETFRAMLTPAGSEKINQ